MKNPLSAVARTSSQEMPPEVEQQQVRASTAPPADPDGSGERPATRLPQHPQHHDDQQPIEQPAEKAPDEPQAEDGKLPASTQTD